MLDPMVPAYMTRQPTATAQDSDHTTHELFLHAARAIVAGRAPVSVRERLLNAKLVYGAGSGEYRGICYYSAWTNGAVHEFVENRGNGRGKQHSTPRDPDA